MSKAINKKCQYLRLCWIIWYWRFELESDTFLFILVELYYNLHFFTLSELVREPETAIVKVASEETVKIPVNAPWNCK